MESKFFSETNFRSLMNILQNVVNNQFETPINVQGYQQNLVNLMQALWNSQPNEVKNSKVVISDDLDALNTSFLKYAIRSLKDEAKPVQQLPPQQFPPAQSGQQTLNQPHILDRPQPSMNTTRNEAKDSIDELMRQREEEISRMENQNNGINPFTGVGMKPRESIPINRTLDDYERERYGSGQQSYQSRQLQQAQQTQFLNGPSPEVVKSMNQYRNKIEGDTNELLNKLQFERNLPENEGNLRSDGNELNPHNFSDINPKQLFDPNVKINRQEAHLTEGSGTTFGSALNISQPLDDLKEPEGLGIISNKPKIETGAQVATLVRKHNIIINSIDRDWFIKFITNNAGNVSTITGSNASRYQYQVRFGPTSSSQQTFPIFENNPTNPATSSQLNNGQRGGPNVSGFTYNSQSYSAYDPSLPVGNIIGQETIKISSTQIGAKVGAVLRDIVRFKCSRLIMPNRDIFHTALDNIDNEDCIHLFDNSSRAEPYVLVVVDEFDSNILSTSSNKIQGKILAKLVYDNTYTSENGRGFTHYINADGDEQVFDPTPYASLNTLNLKILRPDGSLYSTIEDNFRISTILLNNETDPTKSTFVLTLNQYFHREEFKPGDRIVIKNAYFKNSSSFNQILNFINRNEGHIVYTVTGINTNNRLFYNQVVILGPGQVSRSTGQWENDDLLSGVTITDEETDGSIINARLQHNLVFDVETREPRPTMIASVSGRN